MAQIVPSRNWREVVEDGEEALFAGFVQEITQQQQQAARSTGTLRRGFHAKIHVGLSAEFQILPDLPPEARFGVFSEPGKIFPAVVRFSNGEPTPHPDKHAEPRGIAIKLIGVPGSKLLKGQEEAVTQDFLATSHSVTQTVRNVQQFMAFIRAANHGPALPFLLAREVGTQESLRILAALVATVPFSHVRSMVTEQYSSTAPIKLGPFAVKFTIRPAEGTKPPVDRPLTDNFLRDELAERLRTGDIGLDFLVQFYLDDTRTPIEDTSVPWKPADSPLVKLAHVRIPSCNLDTPEARNLTETIDQLSFSPWHATADHRPLGNVMRARKVVYLASSALRGAKPQPNSVPLNRPPPAAPAAPSP